MTVKITFLGTGAADWKPIHKDLEGYRRYSSALVDDCLLIDPGPSVPEALETFGKNANKIKYMINTHSHDDHYKKETVEYLSGAEFIHFAPGDKKVLGNYTVIAVKANHKAFGDTVYLGEAVHFIISDGEKKLFYGLDGAWLLYDEVQTIKKEGVDYAVLDATIGDVPGDYRVFEHNNLNMVIDMKLSLEKHVKRFCICHMARTLHGTQKELSERMAPYGIEVAYDGYETTI